MVVFDTEYAALKVHYKYLGSPGLKFGKSPAWVRVLVRTSALYKFRVRASYAVLDVVNWVTGQDHYEW